MYIYHSTGKDKTVFVTREDADKPAMVSTLVEDETYGIILPDGSINWDCPCLGSLASHTLKMKTEGLVQYGYHTRPLLQKSCSPIRFRIGDDASSEGVYP